MKIKHFHPKFTLLYYKKKKSYYCDVKTSNIIHIVEYLLAYAESNNWNSLKCSKKKNKKKTTLLNVNNGTIMGNIENSVNITQNNAFLKIVFIYFMENIFS